MTAEQLMQETRRYLALNERERAVVEAAKALKKVYLYHRREDIPDHILRVCETIEALEAEEKPRTPSLSKSDNFATTPIVPGDAIRVGDIVRMKPGRGTNAKGTVVCSEPHTYVEWSNRESEYVCTGHLERVPIELPANHIDRHWIVGAWITRGDPFHYVVITGRQCRDLDTGNAWFRFAGSGISNNGTGMVEETGWSFHPSSPIQETREP